jgi:hypothetical protein
VDRASTLRHDHMPSYLVEQYFPKSRLPELHLEASRTEAAARELAGDGVRIRYLRTTFLPDDETCFHLVEATGTDEVGELCRRAGLTNARVTRAVDA